MKPLKSLLYAFMGLLLFGIQTQAQTPDVIPKIESEYGISIRPGGNTFPTRKGFATYLAPIVSDSTLLFYYDIPGRRILIDLSKLGGGVGVAYTPGVGLTLVNKEFGIKQWPAGDVGHIGVKSLNWAEMPQVLDADVLSYSNAKFLMQLGNNTVAMTMGNYQRFLANAFGIGSGGGSGSGSSLRWVTPPQNQNSPGEIGDISYYLGYWYMVGKDVAGINQWYRWDAESQFNSGYTPPSEAGKPGLSAQYNAATNKVVLNWSYDRTDAASWDVFVSFVQNNQYQLIKSGIPAGDRTYSFDNTASAYYIKVRAPKVGGSFTDFSDSAYVQPVQQLAYQPVSNVVITPKNGSNSFDFVFNTADAGGIATLWISTNVNASASTSDGWTKVSDLTIGNAGTYTMNAPGITDTQGRVFKVQRSGGTLTPSVPQKFGPSALSSIGETLNAPSLVSAGVFSGAPNAVQITFLLNNQNVNSLFLRQSEDNGATWTLDRSVTDPNTSTSYVAYGLTAGKTYTFQLYAFKNGNYSPYSETKSVTLSGGSSDQICNVKETASAGYQVTTKTYTITQAGTVYYMLDAGTIPDKLTVKKNNTTVATYDPKSWRTAGQMSVVSGDVVQFIVDPTVTYDQGSAWTLYANCSAAYNVNASQPGFAYANNDYPRIASIANAVSGFNRTFTITATSAIATGSQVVQSKAVQYLQGETFNESTGWTSGLTLNRDQKGSLLNAQTPYAVYVKDANGKIFGIAQVDASKTYESDPSTQPLTFSIASQTPSALTLNVNNPSTTGVYNWGTYSDDPNVSGSYVDGKTNIAGGATLVIDLSSGKYVSGKTYRAYPSQNNGEPAITKQTRGGNYVTFTYDNGSGGGSTSEIVPGIIPQGISTEVPQETKYIYTSRGDKVGMNLAWGAAFTELYQSTSPTENVINNHDLGRQFQYAYYGWPVDAGKFRPQGKDPHPAWATIGWDPIQAGDFTTPSRVLQYKFDQANNAIYYRTKPRMWGYADVECECHVDSWVRINGLAIEVTNILTNYRTDQFEKLPRGQDIGGGHANSYYRYWSGYLGNKPWTNLSTTTIDRSNPPSGQVPIIDDPGKTIQAWLPENWMYNKKANGEGFGVWSKSPYFAAGTVGGLEIDVNTYSGFAANFGTHKELEHIDRNHVLRYDYAYVMGSETDVRNYAYSRRNETWNVINYDFSKDYQGWWTNANFPSGQASEYPFNGYWEVKYDQVFSNFGSPEIAVSTNQYTKLEIVVAVTGGPATANINLLRHRDNALRYNNNQGTAVDETNYAFTVNRDGQFHTYTIDLTSNPDWANSIVSKIYLDFGGSVGSGRTVRLKSIKGLP